MRTHVFITDKRTFPIVRDNGFWGIGVKDIPSEFTRLIEDNLRNPRKPYFSILADVLGTRVGDIVFLYERQAGFHGIYKVKSPPFFDPTPIGSIIDERWPIRMEIECVDYFPKPVPESYLFSTRDYELKCWVWFYRKVQGGFYRNSKGIRGLNTINPEMAGVLIELLVKINGNAESKPESMRSYPHSREREEILLPIRKLSDNDGRILLEDILRAWIISNIDNPEDKSLREIFGPIEDLEWFANNVPYHITGKNIDILVYHKNMKYTGYPLRYMYSVVELKRDRAYSKDVSQLIEYSKWVGGRLAGGDVESVQPILIAFDFARNARLKAKNSDFSKRGIKLYKYIVKDDTVEFKEIET